MNFTWSLAPATVAGAKPLPACLTYRVRFVLRVVPPQPSAAGSTLTDRVSQPAKSTESKPAEPAPAAAPAAVQPIPAAPSK
jgi:hypothetical protein